MSEEFTFKADSPRRWRSRLIVPIRAIGSPSLAGVGAGVAVPVAVGVRVGNDVAVASAVPVAVAVSNGAGVALGAPVGVPAGGGVGVPLGTLIGVADGGGVSGNTGLAVAVREGGRLGCVAICVGNGVAEGRAVSVVGPGNQVSTPSGGVNVAGVAEGVDVAAIASAVWLAGGVLVGRGTVGGNVATNGPAPTVGDPVGTASGNLSTRKGRPKVSITASRTTVRTTASNRLKEGHRDGCSRFGGRKISSRIEPRSEKEVARRPSRAAVTASLTRRRPYSKSARGMAGNWTCAISAARRNSGSSSLACSG